MCTLTYSYAHSPLRGPGTPQGPPRRSQRVVHVPSPGAFLQCLLGQLVSRSWELRTNGTNSAAQTEFVSYSDNFISLFVVLGMVVPSGPAWTAYR